MRSSGLEPPRAVKPTRPSTLRVYQFRHERRVREYSLASVPEIGAPLAGWAHRDAAQQRNRACSAKVRNLRPSTADATVRTRVRFSATIQPNWESSRHGSDQAPARDIRLHPKVLGEVRLPP